MTSETMTDSESERATLATSLIQQVQDGARERHELPEARYYEYTGEKWAQVFADADIYDLLDAVSEMTFLRAPLALGFVTTGWAAPLNADGTATGRPSEHAERVRVMLAVVVTSSGITSAVSLANSDDLMLDHGTATGTLADAVLATTAGVWAK